VPACIKSKETFVTRTGQFVTHHLPDLERKAVILINTCFSVYLFALHIVQNNLNIDEFGIQVTVPREKFL
jgi:hypothetical protein